MTYVATVVMSSVEPIRLYDATRDTEDCIYIVSRPLLLAHINTAVYGVEFVR